jgi:hypothetical protein
MKPIDDYELAEKDFDEFIRRGLEEREWESKYQQRRDQEYE